MERGLHMKKCAVFFHTTFSTPDYMKSLFTKRYPQAELYNIVDDSILQEVAANKCKYTANIVRKLVHYGEAAESAGACVMVNMCTTLAPAVALARESMNIPFLCIDGPMLKEAVHTGKRIALIVTAKTTIEPSTLAMEEAARMEGCSGVEVTTIFVDGAFDALTVERDREKHDMLVCEAVRKAAEKHDVIVLAQVTMARLEKQLTDIKVPILISPDSGLEQLGANLET